MGNGKKKRIKVPVLTVFLCGLTLVLLHFAANSIIEIVNSPSLLEGYSTKSVLTDDSTVKDISFGEDYGDYTEISEKLSNLKSTHKEWTNIDENPEEKGFFCIATEDEGVRMVYNLDTENLCDSGYTLKDFNYLWVDSVNQGFYCVINIPGEIVDLSGYYILVHDDTGNLASRLIINCYEAKALILTDTIVTGTIFAPNANVQYDKTIVYGGVYAKASTGSRSYYKTIEYGGYDVIFDETVKVTLKNYVLHTAIIKYLKENYPETYSTYLDSYVLNNQDLAKVTELDLEGELIANFYDDLSYLVNLEKLIVKNTKLKELDVSKLSKLSYLDISETSITKISLPESNSIKTFIADWSSLTQISTTRLTNATYVSLSRVSFTTLPRWECLSSVTYLDITGTGFIGFSDVQANALSKITELYCSENPGFTSIDLTKMPLITKFEARECGLESISVEGLQNLTEIDISYNNFTEADLSTCDSLTKVSAFGNYKKIIVSSENVEVGKLAETKVEIKTEG